MLRQCMGGFYLFIGVHDLHKLLQEILHMTVEFILVNGEQFLNL